MDIRTPSGIHIYHHWVVSSTDPRIDSILSGVTQALALLGALTNQEEMLMSDLSAVEAAVANEATVEDSAIALLNQLSAQITSNINDPVALVALATSINADAAKLAAAVTANTPVPPAAPPVVLPPTAPATTTAPVDPTLTAPPA